MSLLALQRDLRTWLVDADERAAARLGGAGAPGLDVYQNNYRSALVGCLEGSFGLTRAWLGERAFLRAAVDHIDRVPPSSWTLDAYARDFPATLAMLFADDAEVAELARIELALDEAFVAPDADAIGADRLANRDWDRAVLRLTPTLDFVPLRTNASALWSALVEGRTPPPAETLDAAAIAAVWRVSTRTRIRVIDTDEHFALTQARAGMSFAALCDRIAAQRGSARGVALAGEWLGRWIADGLVVAIDDE